MKYIEFEVWLRDIKGISGFSELDKTTQDQLREEYMVFMYY